ncbi:MAG: ABC-type spermidine/putrescine transport system, ATPase component [halophilic archaeon J07HX5]|jgi:ABC-type spermidine/putrescine transport systems, ATPase components|nr:MAG: ABC-type spermidine/putrescine transport system, ATPase component [halophilic archaeon J07HX5]
MTDLGAGNANVILEANEIRKEFSDTVAVEGLSLSVKRGEFFSLVGPSGCGKTTTLRMLAGLTTPTSGTVQLNGINVTDRPARKRDTNLVFQDLVLFPHMSVAENVGYGLARQGVPAPKRSRRVSSLLETVDLGGLGDRQPTELSGGQRQRVALARGLAPEPSVLLLDEPLSSLDRKLRQEMQAELRRVQRDVGTTFLYVTHDQDAAMSMSDRVAVMNDGQIVESGAPEALYDRPATAFVADFLGDANILAGTVTSVANDTTTVAIGTGTVQAAPGSQAPAVEDSVAVMVRPEDLTLGDGPLSATVQASEFKGFYDKYTLALSTDETGVITARTNANKQFETGDVINLSITNATMVALNGEAMTIDELRRSAVSVGTQPDAPGGVGDRQHMDSDKQTARTQDQ